MPCVVYGGESTKVQMNDLNDADYHILVATPGQQPHKQLQPLLPHL